MQKTSYSWWLGFLILWSLLLSARAALCEPLTETQSVDKAIEHILSKGLPEHHIKPNLGHTLLKNPVKRRELAAAIVTASKKKE